MIGNDIIDLNELHQHPRAGHIRFRRKILAEPEMEWLRLCVNPALDIWKLWALKESAYKCYFQRTRHRFFSPRKFICQSDASEGHDLRQVTVGTPIGLLRAEICQTDQYIHALCSDEEERMAKAKFRIVALPEGDARVQSSVLREEGLNWIAQCLEYAPGQMVWDDTAGHPRLRLRGALLSVSISLSHHGRWGAVAFLKGPGAVVLSG